MAGSAPVSVLFTDLAGSTEILSRLGDDAADVLRRRHFSILREAISSHGGEEVKSLGDGLMVVFEEPGAGAACAVAMQEGIARHNDSEPERRLGLRVGLHHGRAINDEGRDYFGTTVVVASRLCDRAEPAQILMSLNTRKQIATQAEFAFMDRGSLSLKGLADPVPTVELSWASGAAHAAAPSPATTPAQAGEEAGAVPLPEVLAGFGSKKLMGREVEFERLRAYLGAAEEGERKLVLLAGEPGIGKTRLSAEIAELAAERGATVLFGRSDEGGIISFQPFLEAVGHFIEHGPASVLQAQRREHLASLARLLPALSRRVAIVDQPSEDPETERYRLFEALLALFNGMGEGKPVVLVLDDLHWADQATLLVLRHIIRATSGSSLLVVGTYRNVEVGPSHPLSALITDLHRDRLFNRIDLDGLDEEAVANMIEAWAGQAPPSGLAHTVWQETEGHPFFVEEVLRHLLASGAIHERQGKLDAEGLVASTGIPEGIRAVIESRLANLSEPTQRTLAVAAVVGRDFQAKLLEQVVDTPLDELNEQLEEANAARLLVESRGRLGVYSFSHALVRETLYASLTATRRARFHELIAEAIENMPEGEDGEMLPDLAHHYFEAASGTQVLEKAIGYAAEAGARASEQLAYEQAATQYRRALNGLRLKDTDKERQCELLLELGENLWNSGEYGQARDSFREAAGLAEQLARPHLLARAALGVGGRLGLPLEGGITDSVLISTLRRSLELLGSDDPPLRARLMGRLGSAVLFSEERDHGEKLAREAIILARMTGDDALLARILSDTWLACTRRGNLDERLARGRENVEVADRTGVATLRLESRLWLAAAMYEEGEIEATAPILETCRMLVEELHQPYYTWFYTLFESAQGIMVGDLDAAEARMWEALDSGQKSDNPCAAELFAPQSLMLRLLQGRIAETHAGSKAMTSHFASIFAFRSGLATIYAEMGLVPEAKREFERLAVNGFRDISDDVFWLSTVHLLADVCAFLEDSERAAELYELLLPCSGRYVMLGAMCAAAGSVDRGLGVLCTVMGRLDEADAFLAKAAELEERVGSIPALAMTRCDQARVHVLRGTPEDIVAAQRLLAAARAVTASHDLGGIDHRIDAVQILITGDDPHVHAQRRRRRRDDVKAAISTRGRASLGRIVGDASDEDIERRFGSKLALRGLFSGMAQGFQPRMALGFEGEISFEVWQQTASGTARTSDWWTIQITSTKATARHRTAKAPAATIHAPLPDLIRVVAGLSNPVTMWVEKRIEVDGDILLSTRLVELFGGEEPLEIG